MRLESGNPRHINMSLLQNCLVVVLAALCVAPALAQFSVQDIVKLGGVMQRCQQETGASNDDIQSIFRRKVPETRSGKCMLACAGEALGLMRGGSIDAEGTLAIAGHLMQGRDQTFQDTVKNAILTCAKNSDTRRAGEKLKPYQSFKSTSNGIPRPNRVRRQSVYQDNTLSNPSQPTPYAPAPAQAQTYPNRYPNQQDPNQQYPLQNNQNNPTTNPLAQLGRIFDSINPVNTYPYNQPYVQPYQQPYVQPVIVATPLTGVGLPVVPFRGKRSPQELILQSTEITLPPEVAAEISERLRELLLALISSQDGLNLNSTQVTEKDAEIFESITSPPRRRRQSDQKDLSSTHLIDRVVRNGPIHRFVQDLRNLMPNSTTSTDGSTTAGTGTPALDKKA